MSGEPIPEEVRSEIEAIVDRFREDLDEYERISRGLVSLFTHKSLRPLIHSIKSRVKDPDHLGDKLERKYRESVEKKLPFDIDRANFTSKVNDLVGVRILHLNTQQFPRIDAAIKALLEEEVYSIVEGPKAKYWDNEYKQFFESIGVEVEDNARLYTSVHYVVSPSSKTTRTCEIQVRTLAEELWGEVDHAMNYPTKQEQLAVREQILVLARMTSSCTRLVDSIFKCVEKQPGS